MPDPWLVLQWLFVLIVAWFLILVVIGSVSALRSMGRGEDDAEVIVVDRHTGEAERYASWSDFWHAETERTEAVEYVEYVEDDADEEPALSWNQFWAQSAELKIPPPGAENEEEGDDEEWR